MNDELMESEGKPLSRGFDLPSTVPITPVRSLSTVESELHLLQEQTQRIVLSYAIEAGRRLEEAKAMLHHGEWGGWLKKMGFAKSSAQNLMRIFREYGASQQSLFGGTAKSQALGNLSYTKALLLLALPDTEAREQFVAEYDVEAMSTRELEQAIKDRDAAREAAAEAQSTAEQLQREADRLQEQLHDQVQVYKAKLTAAGAEAEHAKANAKNAEEARAKMAEDMKIVKASLKNLKGQQADADKYKTEAENLRSELEQLRKRPIDMAVEVREPTPEEMERLTAGAIEKARAEDAERVQELEKQLTLADGDSAAFRVLFESWQDVFRKMMVALEQISAKDEEKGGKLLKAIRAVLDERMAAECR